MGNEDHITKLFRTMTARKISVISRLAGLTEEEIQIMKYRWLENKSDVQICDIMGISSATLTRKRRAAKGKIVDAMDLYGLSDLDSLPASCLLDYNGKFYLAQDELIKFFMKHTDTSSQEKVLNMLKIMNGDD